MFAEAGDTLIDTANNYTNGSAESILGELLAADRDHFVVGAKYSLNVRDGDLNAGGNHHKNLVQALEGSLRRLRIDHVDVLWLHAWDYLTPPGEVMRALDDQVRLGKVLNLGVSDAPAWVVAQMQTLAAARGWTLFAGLQIEYSLVQREVERELLPMARDLGLGVLAWGPLGAGVLSSKYAGPAKQSGQRRLADVDPGQLAVARRCRRRQRPRAQLLARCPGPAANPGWRHPDPWRPHCAVTGRQPGLPRGHPARQLDMPPGRARYA